MPQPKATPPKSHLDGWQNLVLQSNHSSGLTENSVQSIMGSLRSSTQKQYSVYIHKFLRYCNFVEMTSFEPTEVDVINFLQSLFDSGLSYGVINTACSAVKTFLGLVNIPVVFSARISRFKKGCFNQRPSLPKHVATWDPDTVLKYIDGLGKDLDLLTLTCKCITLLALASYQRVSTLQAIQMSDVKFLPNKVILSFSSLHKQSRPGHHLSGMELNGFHNENVCVVKTMELYLKAVEPIRLETGLSSFFITCVKPYRHASKDTISRWLKSMLHRAGISSVYSAHSTRSAATSADAAKGVDVATIMEKAGWSSSSTFYRFYNKPLTR